MTNRDLNVVILAAGQGTRMRSDLPKVLHPLAGRPLLEHVISAAWRLGVEQPHVIYGHGGERVPQTLAGLAVHWIEQSDQLGTGHAVLQAMPFIGEHGTVLVLYGDVPLIGDATLGSLVALAGDDSLGLLTVELDDPAGYGRIIRDADSRVVRIVEEKDTAPEERAVREVNTGMLAVGARRLRAWLDRLDNRNAQGEYYLTDIVAMAVGDGVPVHTVAPAAVTEVMGVNDRAQLSVLERHYQAMQAQELMKAGVTMQDPARFDLRGTLQVGRDITIDVNVIIEGEVRLGDRARVGPNVLLRNCRIGADAVIEANCVVEDAVIDNAARIGPFARIRPGTHIAEDARVGNFVEIKKSDIGVGSKVNHLSYVGDSSVGRGVNIGAGTITCNYDGANKHRTIIGDNAFIGSNTQLVAPVEVGAGATIGAGSTITRDAPAEALTLSRAPQKTLTGWTRPTKKRD